MMSRFLDGNARPAVLYVSSSRCTATCTVTLTPPRAGELAGVINEHTDESIDRVRLARTVVVSVDGQTLVTRRCARRDLRIGPPRGRHFAKIARPAHLRCDTSFIRSSEPEQSRRCDAGVDLRDRHGEARLDSSRRLVGAIVRGQLPLDDAERVRSSCEASDVNSVVVDELEPRASTHAYRQRRRQRTSARAGRPSGNFDVNERRTHALTSATLSPATSHSFSNRIALNRNSNRPTVCVRVPARHLSRASAANRSRRRGLHPFHSRARRRSVRRRDRRHWKGRQDHRRLGPIFCDSLNHA